MSHHAETALAKTKYQVCVIQVAQDEVFNNSLDKIVIHATDTADATADSADIFANTSNCLADASADARQAFADSTANSVQGFAGADAIAANAQPVAVSPVPITLSAGSDVSGVSAASGALAVSAASAASAASTAYLTDSVEAVHSRGSADNIIAASTLDI